MKTSAEQDRKKQPNKALNWKGIPLLSILPVRPVFLNPGLAVLG